MRYRNRESVITHEESALAATAGFYRGEDLTAPRGGGGTGGGGFDPISGTADADALDGTNNADTILGFAGDDILRGFANDDVLIGGAGKDVIEGGDGFDRISFRGAGSTGVTFDLDSNGTSIAYVAGLASDEVRGVEGIIGSNMGDVFSIAAASGSIEGGAGDDTVYINESNRYAGAALVLAGGQGDHDTIDLGRLVLQGFELLLPDYLGFEDVNGSEGSDYILGNGRSNTLHGATGSDWLVTRSTTAASPDHLFGDAGNDLLQATLRHDSAGDLHGVGGDDAFMLGFYANASGTIDVAGGTGSDFLIFSLPNPDGTRSTTLTMGTDRIGAGDISVTSISGDSVTISYTGIENIVGGGTNDAITGDAGANRIYGGTGADTIDGGAGDDRISGGLDMIPIGNTVLLPRYVDDGADVLTGGAGADRFVFVPLKYGSGFSTDTITDFTRGEGDRIDLSPIVARPGLDASFVFVGTAAFTHIAGELRYEIDGADVLVQGDTDADGVADITIRVEGLQSLVAGDFIL